MAEINKLLSILRDRSTNMISFKKASNELAILIAESVKKEINSESVVLVPILRAGMALLPTFMDTFESARVGFVGIHRDEKAFPHLYYEKLPPLSATDHVIILDPMVATGGSTLVTLEKLTSIGADPTHISIVGMIGAPEGKEAILNRFPSIHLHLAILDEKLDDKKYIFPGLGDFGDRFFGTN
ncbi:MAG: uracil phosphoribosyltransferase [Simkaniaceae bacterium]|nr:MAG: uracil phosphoribosyltransferase [Simkaniaceae bacterium]